MRRLPPRFIGLPLAARLFFDNLASLIGQKMSSIVSIHSSDRHFCLACLRSVDGQAPRRASEHGVFSLYTHACAGRRYRVVASAPFGDATVPAAVGGLS